MMQEVRNSLACVAASASMEAMRYAMIGTDNIHVVAREVGKPKDNNMWGMHGSEMRAWTEEDQERADEYARQKGIGFHNRLMLNKKIKDKKQARAKAKKQRKARKANR